MLVHAPQFPLPPLVSCLPCRACRSSSPLPFPDKSSPPMTVLQQQSSSMDGDSFSSSAALLQNTGVRIGGSSTGSALGRRASVASSSYRCADASSCSSHGQEGGRGGAWSPQHQQRRGSSAASLLDGQQDMEAYLGHAGLPMLASSPRDPLQDSSRRGVGSALPGLLHIEGCYSSADGRSRPLSGDPLPRLAPCDGPLSAAMSSSGGGSGTSVSGPAGHRQTAGTPMVAGVLATAMATGNGGHQGHLPPHVQLLPLQEDVPRQGPDVGGCVSRRPPTMSPLPEAGGEGEGEGEGEAGLEAVEAGALLPRAAQ